LSGNYLSIKQCLNCSENAYPGPPFPVYSCRACPNGQKYDKKISPWKCICELTDQVVAGDECVPLSDSKFLTDTYPLNAAKSLTYNNQETNNERVDSTLTIASSDTFDFLYLKSAYHCLASLETKSCQILANLCVLQLYDENNPVCKLYQFINNQREIVNGANE